jgi:hypothetical protein
MLTWIERLDHVHRSEPDSGCPPAVDAISSVIDVADQVWIRCERLSGPLATSSDDLLRSRVREILTVLNEIAPLTSETGADIDGPTNRVDTLSPSDFGPHNLLHDPVSGRYRMVDLEFFGVDDAHKLVGDAILHPQNGWTAPLLAMFIDGARATLGTSDARLARLMPFLCLKWATIVLARTVRDASSVDVSRREPSLTWGLDLADHYLRLARTVRHEDRLGLVSELPKRPITPDEAAE